jgi:hypothetical protein
VIIQFKTGGDVIATIKHETVGSDATMSGKGFIDIKKSKEALT